MNKIKTISPVSIIFAIDFLLIELLITGGRHCRDRKVVGLTTILMESVPITTNIVSTNSAQARCTRYNIM